MICGMYYRYCSYGIGETTNDLPAPYCDRIGKVIRHIFRFNMKMNRLEHTVCGKRFHVFFLQFFD